MVLLMIIYRGTGQESEHHRSWARERTLDAFWQGLARSRREIVARSTWSTREKRSDPIPRLGLHVGPRECKGRALVPVWYSTCGAPRAVIRDARSAQWRVELRVQGSVCDLNTLLLLPSLTPVTDPHGYRRRRRIQVRVL